MSLYDIAEKLRLLADQADKEARGIELEPGEHTLSSALAAIRTVADNRYVCITLDVHSHAGSDPEADWRITGTGIPPVLHSYKTLTAAVRAFLAQNQPVKDKEALEAAESVVAASTKNDMPF